MHLLFLLSNSISNCCTMASQVAPQAYFALHHASQGGRRRLLRWRQVRQRTPGYIQVFATQNSENSKKVTPGEDTRIHWENEDEGWIGGGKENKSSQFFNKEDDDQEKDNFFGDKFSELLNNSTDSHYQYLGISPGADLEEIKGAYRRLSKEYHPDTTSLPLKTASEKFMRLREIYDVLSDEEKRRFYDWTLAQEAASREAEKLRVRLEDPYMREVNNFVSVPDMVDRLGGKNLELSDQAKSALTFDFIAIIFSICSIIYAIYFKQQY